MVGVRGGSNWEWWSPLLLLLVLLVLLFEELKLWRGEGTRLTPPRWWWCSWWYLGESMVDGEILTKKRNEGKKKRKREREKSLSLTLCNLVW